MSTTDKLTDEQWLIQHLEDDAEACSAVNGSKDITTKDARRAEVTVKRLIRERDDARRASQSAPAPFQDRVDPWMQACFGAEVSADKLERGDRLLEEVLELLQSGDYPSERVAMLTSYVWSRDIGEPAQEVGGVMVTLASYCLAHGLNMHDAGETELARIWTKVEKIRAKQAAKPKGSALPQVWAAPAPSDALREVLEAAERFISGFEGDEVQDGIADLLSKIRAALSTATKKERYPLTDRQLRDQITGGDR